MISTTHGVTFKNNDNWRFDAKMRGVGEMNTCHFVSFCDIFGEIKKYKFENNYAKNISKKILILLI